MYRKAVDRYCTVPAGEYKIFVYVDKIYSDFKKSRNSDLVKTGYLAIENTGFGRFFFNEIGVTKVA